MCIYKIHAFLFKETLDMKIFASLINLVDKLSGIINADITLNAHTPIQELYLIAPYTLLVSSA